jgi:hypothetical protein
MEIRELAGNVILPNQLCSRRAIDISRYLNSESIPYFRMIECRETEHHETLVVEIGLAVSQRPKIDIKSKEILGISFEKDKDSLPLVFPLRINFPIDHVHVMIDFSREYPILCLWEEDFEDVKYRLTPYLFLISIKEWLEKTSEGLLHDDNQPLEPILLSGIGQIILPNEEISSSKRYIAVRSEETTESVTLRFVEQDKITRQLEQPSLVLAVFQTQPITHQASRYALKNLKQLKTLLDNSGLDLKAELKKWLSGTQQDLSLSKLQPVILIRFQKKRIDEGPVESIENWAFTAQTTVSALGESLGVFADASRYGVQAMGTLLGNNEEQDNLEQFPIFALTVIQELSRDQLPILSGQSFKSSPSIVAIGTGALGSKIIELAIRCGFGKWSLIDKDVFLPHNAVRHVLGDWAIGDYKAKSLQGYINNLVPGQPVQNAIVADIKNLADQCQILDIFQDADLILDMSASVTVARTLCKIAYQHRLVSLFLNPNGQDIALLLESKNYDHKVSLWDLESSYYREIIRNKNLHGHLAEINTRTRYGNGCRDLTAQISAAQISTLAGIALHQLIQRLSNEKGSAAVWRSNLSSGEVKSIELEARQGREIHLNGWKIIWKVELIEDMVFQRNEALPNETGGVLLGIVDFEHQVIVVTADIPAPEDSLKRPYFFERGTNGLSATLADIEEKTAGQLRYIGEWHSHPDGSVAQPSSDDENVFSELEKVFDRASEPYTMAILSQNQLFTQIGFFGKSESLTLSLEH